MGGTPLSGGHTGLEGHTGLGGTHWSRGDILDQGDTGRGGTLAQGRHWPRGDTGPGRGMQAQGHASNLSKLNSHALTLVTRLPGGKGRMHTHKKRQQRFAFLAFALRLSFFLVPLKPCFRERLHAVMWDLARGQQDGMKTRLERQKKGSDSAERVCDSKLLLSERTSFYNVSTITNGGNLCSDKDGNANRQENTGSRETSLCHLYQKSLTPFFVALCSQKFRI